jgi:hypothetical protein
MLCAVQSPIIPTTGAYDSMSWQLRKAARTPWRQQTFLSLRLSIPSYCLIWHTKNGGARLAGTCSP